jgi:hypothetical protein
VIQLALEMSGWFLHSRIKGKWKMARKTLESRRQRMTLTGVDAAAFLDAVASPLLPNQRLINPKERYQSLVEFMQGLDLSGLDLTRERDTGREAPF